MHHIKPLGSYVLIKRSKAAQTKGGIYLPETALEKPKEGTVLEVGSGSLGKNGKIIPVSLKKGDKVLFVNYGGTEVQKGDSDDELLILSEDDILGIIEQ